MPKFIKLFTLCLCTTLLLAQTAFAQDITSGLVGHWKLNDGSGLTASDNTGGSNGTLENGPTWTTGQVGYALDYDGYDDYITFGTVSGLSLTDMTLSAWVYIPTSIPSGYRTIIEYDRFENNWYGLWQNDNKLHFRWANSDANGRSDSTISISPDTWYHLVGVYDSSTNTSEIWVNGVLDTTIPSALTATPRENQLITIGANNLEGEFFKGTIDDVRIYNRALTSDDVEALYNYTECSDPFGEPGALIYNVNYNVMQYCDSTDWIGFPEADGEGGGSGEGGSFNGKVDTGHSYGCVIDADGAAWCWGQGSGGKLGDGNTGNHLSPVRVGTSGSSTLWSDWEYISAGDTHTCGIRNGGEAYCWGDNSGRQLGNGALASTNVPERVGTAGTSTLWDDWVSISAGKGGFYHTCGLREDGSAWCWGDGDAGQIGNNNDSVYSTPVQVGTSGTSTLWTDWNLINAGAYNTCGIRNGGEAYCWGNGNNGVIGDGNTGFHQTPQRVGTAGTSTLWGDWDTISTGNYTSCGVRSNGEAYCWGSNSQGQIGNNSTSTSTTPQRVGTAGTSTLWSDWVDISVSGETTEHTCGVRSNGEAYCWGYGPNGEVGEGSGSPSVNYLVPEQVATYTDWVDVSAHGYNSCGTRESGEIYCWGANGFGQIGDSTSGTDRTAPTAVGSLSAGGGDGGGGGSGCADPVGNGGALIYDNNDNVLLYCNGSNWVASGTAPGSGGAGCSDPVGDAGAMVYNSGDNVMTYCDGADWIAIGKNMSSGGGGSAPTGCATFGPCDDGSTYFADHPVDGGKLYYEAVSGSSVEWGSMGTARGTTDYNDGQSNTETLASFGATAHPAAYACANSTALGYNDWYLPSSSEGLLVVDYSGVTEIWTSTEANADEAGYVLNQPPAIDFGVDKDSAVTYICIRKVN